MSKNIFPLLAFTAMLFAAFSCTDNTALQEKVDELDSRLARVEETIRNLNGEVARIQEIVNKLSSGYVVTSCEKTTDGYRITFSDKSYIDISNGKDGEDAKSPEIGVRQDTDGNWYWTLGGAWLTDAAGRRVKANGDDAVAPTVKVQDGYWWLSTDGGASWSRLAPYYDPAATVIKSVDAESDPLCITITLSDGTVIILPRRQELAIAFDSDTVAAFAPGETRSLGFTLTGGTEKNVVKAIGQGGWIASVTMESSSRGVLSVTAPDPIVTCEVVVIASDGYGYTVIGSLDLEEGVVRFITTGISIGGDGGSVELEVEANADYTVIPDVDWVTVTQTRSIRKEVLVFNVSGNYSTERFCTVSLVAGGEVRSTAVIAQDAAFFEDGFGVSSPEGKVCVYDRSTDLTGLHDEDGKTWSRILLPSTLTCYEIGPIPSSPEAGTCFDGTLSVVRDGSARESYDRTFTVVDHTENRIRLTDSEGFYYVLRD